MEWDFINVKTLFLIAHLFGLALGAGGAFISDILFLKSVKDRKITKTASLSSEVEKNSFYEADSRLKAIVDSEGFKDAE